MNIYLSRNDNKIDLEYKDGQNLESILKYNNINYKEYFGAFLDNEIVGLREIPKKDSVIRFLDISTTQGNRIYTSSLCMLFQCAEHRLFPNKRSKIHFFIGSQIYTESESDEPYTFEEISMIEHEMKKMVANDEKIVKELWSREDAIEYFSKRNVVDKVKLLEQIDDKTVTLYRIDDFLNRYEDELVPSCGYINRFSLKYYYPGLLILFPSKKNNYDVDLDEDLPKLSKVFQDANKVSEILKISNVIELNEEIEKGNARDVVLATEAFLNNKYYKVAKQIAEDEAKKVVLISGPSSSGKTTTAQKLKLELKLHGINAVEISTDDYFVDRENTPKKPDGSYDFETIDAVDTLSLNKDIMKLLETGKIKRRKFDFINGKSIKTDEDIVLDNRDIIIIEGIHALNPNLINQIPNRNKFKIYLSALININIDYANRISTTDARFIRRMVRDNIYRGRDVFVSLDGWKSVREGEEIYVFPYQEEADVILNTSLLYELAVLKKHAESLLKLVTKDSMHFARAKRLLKLLHYFKSIDDESIIPNTSLIREFIGGSVFN